MIFRSIPSSPERSEGRIGGSASRVTIGRLESWSQLFQSSNPPFFHPYLHPSQLYPHRAVVTAHYLWEDERILRLV
jgi:hypothetical protein